MNRSLHPSLREVAKTVRSHGQRGDSVLAHINPQEARLLSRTYGGDINPETGLPQFGLKKFFKKAAKTTGKVFKKSLPILGGFLGNAIAPGIGTAIGGALGGALSSKNHKLEHALFGAAMFPVVDTIAPHLQSFFTSSPSTGADSAAASSAGGGYGAGDAAIASGSALSASKDISDAVSSKESVGFGKKLLDQLLENPLNTALGATAITGMLASKPKLQKDLGPTPEEEMIRFNQAREKHGGPLYEPYRKVKPYHETRRYIQPTPEDLMTNKPWQYFDDVHPPIEYYAEGGHVKDLDDEWRDIRGYIDGDDGGQDDNILLDVEPDSYIMNATVTSLLGDGNSKNGKKKLEHWEEEVLQDKHGTISGVSDGRKVKIAISPGERIMSPKFVESVGKGSKKRGGKVLDKFSKNVVKHKGLKNFLPPKSKSIDSYLRSD